MSWEISCLEDVLVVLVKYTGKTTYEEFKRSTRQSRELMNANDTQRVLVDATDLELAISTNEIYDFPKFYMSLGIPFTTRIALLMPQDRQYSRESRFYETVCANRGYRVKSFVRMEEALQWLQGPEGA